ncbi:MAG: GGDEF domain-containing protein [Oceanospirillaceae bacterium]|nr:GGDEF domain-containing protein [Oceanospirillaceae bacterium]
MLIDLLREVYSVCQGYDKSLDDEMLLLLNSFEQHGSAEITQEQLNNARSLRAKLNQKFDQSTADLEEVNQQLFALEVGSKKVVDIPIEPESVIGETNCSHVVQKMQQVLGHYQAAVTNIHRQLDEKYSSDLQLINDSKLNLTNLYKDIQLDTSLRPRLNELSVSLAAVQTTSGLFSNFEALIAFLLHCINKEKSASAEFFVTLNLALNTVQGVVTESTALNNNSFSKRKIWDSFMSSNINDITCSVAEIKSKSQPVLAIEHSVKSLIQAMLQKQQFDQDEYDKLIAQFVQMQKKLDIVEAQTTQYKTLLDKQKKLSLEDPLTKLPNRAALDERFSTEFDFALEHDLSLWVAVVDIDNFKDINDNFGHNAGDKTLRIIAAAINKSLRSSEFVARFGGEEFVILVPDSNRETLAAILNRIRIKIQAIPFKFKHNNITITVSIGATKVTDQDKKMADSFERADTALYRAKENGRNRVEIN